MKTYRDEKKIQVYAQNIPDESWFFPIAYKAIGDLADLFSQTAFSLSPYSLYFQPHRFFA